MTSPGRKPRWSEDALRAAVARGQSVSDVLRALGLRPAGGNFATVHRAIERLGLDTAHFVGRGWRRLASTPMVPARPLDAVLVRNSPHLDRGSLKRRLIRAGILTYACATCGIAEWRGEPLALELDHVNGDGSDNRIDNLRLLCPNCHSQTATYRGRNIGRARWRVREQPGWRNWFTRPA